MFDLTTEKAATRDKYGRNLFGQGCLLARRLVEKGVPFVEVTLGDWDTHGQNFDLVKNLCGTLDAAWAALMDDLKDRGLLDTTTIVWMGEFGRTPKINPQQAAATTSPTPGAPFSPAAASRAGRRSARRARTARRWRNGRRPRSTCSRRSAWRWASTTRRRTRRTSGRPIRIVDKPCNPIKEVVV